MVLEKNKNKKRGRPLADIKVRSVKGITPKGFEMQNLNKKMITFRKIK